MSRPTARGLRGARRVLDGLIYDKTIPRVHDGAGADMWDSLVEGRRALTMYTEALDHLYPGEGYHEAWIEMMGGAGRMRADR